VALGGDRPSRRGSSVRDKSMKILVLPRYGPLAASSRLRFFQFLPALRSAGMEAVVSQLIDDRLLVRKYRRGGYGMAMLVAAYVRRVRALLRRNQFDLLWIEKEALPWLPVWFEEWLLGAIPYVLDFDDAIFHNYDRSRSTVVRGLFGTRIDRLMARAQVVVAGNSYLAERAMRSGAARTHILPTVIDLERYARKVPASGVERPRIVWIGSPSTTQYLSMLAGPLAQLARTHEFTLRVIGGTNVRMPGVPTEVMPWSESAEAEAIRACDIGVMPLPDNEWERGKCAYKLIQYMACGLPTVASPVGANCDVTTDGQTGYLARTDSDWIARLEALLSDAALRTRMGNAGRASVEQKYSLQRIAPDLATLLLRAGGSH
jgi:glycosyltransferase involved in cell wall biosynthesis